MWIGKIEELENCKLLSDNVKASILDFFSSNNLKELANGRYDLGDGNYVNIFDYETDEVDDTFEAHKKYIDIHYAIIGEETIRVCDKVKEIINPYDEQEDYYLCKVENPDKYILTGEKLCLCMVDEPHQPGGVQEVKMNVKKAVFKIKIA